MKKRNEILNTTKLTETELHFKTNINGNKKCLIKIACGCESKRGGGKVKIIILGKKCKSKPKIQGIPHKKMAKLSFTSIESDVKKSLN